jgi:hypothetical protein
MATEVLFVRTGGSMICPACKNENEMAYSALVHGFVCQEPHCGLELPMEHCELAILLAASIEDHVYA